mmetsp:Transcript_3749/g.10831  ORF Transcript_3749/g.10831 Transcript_3749/m.10831 type:complete len:230 (-) Transcript_3749:669-1358(-)
MLLPRMAQFAALNFALAAGLMCTIAAKHSSACVRTAVEDTAWSPRGAPTRMSTTPEANMASALWGASASAAAVASTPEAPAMRTRTASRAYRRLAACWRPRLPPRCCSLSRDGSTAMLPNSLNMRWLLPLRRSRLCSSCRQSCTTTPPSAAPSALMMVSSRSKAPSKAAIFWMSALEWVSTIMSNRASLRTTSLSAIMSISRTTPIGYASTASCKRCGDDDRPVSICSA